MTIKTIPVGYLQANCYLLKENNKCIIIDPGDEREKIEESIKNLEVVGVLLTHNHFDHNGELKYFEDKYNLKHNDKILDFPYEIIKTPGHSKDSLTFYFPQYKIMFTGDFLFQNGIGRTDFLDSNWEEMIASLKKIQNYPEDITIYPGHGDKSTLKQEKNNINYFILQ